MFKDKDKDQYNDSSRAYEESGLTYDESTQGDRYNDSSTTYQETGLSHYESTRGDTTYASTRGGTTASSEYDGIEIADTSESETLETVPEEGDFSYDDDDSSRSGFKSYNTDLEDEESEEKDKRRRCPKRYPLWLCPPFWFMHPQKASRNRVACMANAILIGCAVYYLFLVEIGVDNEIVTQYLWLVPTGVILYTANLVKNNFKLAKVVVILAARVQEQIEVQNEMAEDINKLGEKGRQYRQEVVNLRDVICETKQAGKQLAWRNKQSINEVNKVDKYIAPYKPPKTVDLPDAEEEHTETAGKTTKTPDKPKEKNEEEKKKPADKDAEVHKIVGSEDRKTQGYLVDSRQQLTTKREILNQRMEEQEEVLEDVREGVTMLQDYHDEFNDESETMKETVNKLKETVGEYDTVMDRFEDIKETSQDPLDQSNADLFQFLTEIHKKRNRLRKLTVVMEISILRDRFLSRQYRTGETGMCRDEFADIKDEIPTAAQRAIINMGEKATFDVLRVKSKKKEWDSKIGRKKRPGIDQAGMLAFLLAVEEQMKNDMNKPLKGLLMPKVNIET